MASKFCNENRTVTDFIALIRKRSKDNKVEFLSRVKKCRFWNDEAFVAKHFKKFVEAYLEGIQKNASSEEVPEVFFSFFMHDWHDPEPNQDYGMLNKVKMFCDVAKEIPDGAKKKREAVQQITSERPVIVNIADLVTPNPMQNSEINPLLKDGSGEKIELNEMFGAELSGNTNRDPKILEPHPMSGVTTHANGRKADTTFVATEIEFKSFYDELIRIFDDKRHSNYHDVLLRMMCLLMEEKENSGHVNGNELKFILDAFIGTTFGNRSLQEKIREMVLAFGANHDEVANAVFNTELSPKEEAESNFMNLCRCLIIKNVVRFKRLLVNFIADAKSEFGDYFYIPIHQRILTASIIAKKLKLFQTCAFIMREFPYIGINSTIITGLDRGLKFRRFKVFKFNEEKFEEWVMFT